MPIAADRQSGGAILPNQHFAHTAIAVTLHCYLLENIWWAHQDSNLGPAD